ncbi:MAG: DUF1285 domain-containing protein [Pseudomonadales bacterium]|nr:DUF1285 domain-containing protein [Pseudomonadales bacterium]
MSTTGFDADALFKQIRQSTGPAPVHLWNPPFCGDIDMRIASDGTWYYQGTPVGRKAMVKLFSSVLRLDEDGCYYLVTPVEKVRIRVDDCPFVAVLLDVQGQGHDQELVFTTNTEEKVVAGAENPLLLETDPETAMPHPRLLCRSNLYALINRNVFYQLADLSTQESSAGKPGVWSRGCFFHFA